jgi:hypothetical protein
MTNTSTTALFASLLNGVRRINPYNNKTSALLYEDEVLAALAAAVPADLAEAGKRAAYIANECLQAADVLSQTDTFQSGQAVFRDASAQITALIALATAQAARIEGLEKERDEAHVYNEFLLKAHEAAIHQRDIQIAALAAEREKVAKLVEALVTARNWVFGCTQTGINQDLAEADLSTIDAAITEAGK